MCYSHRRSEALEANHVKAQQQEHAWHPEATNSNLCQRHKPQSARIAPYTRMRPADSSAGRSVSGHPKLELGVMRMLTPPGHPGLPPAQDGLQQQNAQWPVQSTLLNAAISMASRSMAATMAAFHHACSLPPESAAAMSALDAAEQHMARAAKRAELACHLAASLIAAHSMRPAGCCDSQPQQQWQQQQRLQEQPMLHPWQLCTARVCEDEDGEEVSSNLAAVPST